MATVFALLFSCAKKGRPSGGPKDEDAPLFIVANPPYKATNFNANEITLEFDEFVVLKDLNKQLVVSPPYQMPPLITPQGTPGKEVVIKILDTLKPNTTYIYNFGSSLQDNNEGNVFENFNYVFSTGDYIDSLTQKGAVKDALDFKDVKGIKMAMYRIDSSYTDSIIFKQKPDYVTSTIDTSLYQFTNLKKGKYFLYAIDDANGDYIYNPKADRLGMYKDTLELPKDSVLSERIRLFKERLAFTFKRAKEDRKGKLIFGYEGDPKGFSIELISKVSDNFKSIEFFEKGKDTVNYFHSKIDADSLNFIVKKDNFIDTITVRLRKKELDSLSLTPSKNGSIELSDTLFFTPNNPITKLDTTKFQLFDKDTLPVSFKAEYSKEKNRLNIYFNKQYSQKYKLNILPNAVEDIFNFANDSLKVKLSTRGFEDYGNITLNIENTENIPVIIDLLNSNGIVERRAFISNSGTVNFKNIVPKKYRIRYIIDTNNNKMWDTGDYFTRKQPEKVIYFLEEFSVRAYFDIIESLTIKSSK